MGILIAVEGIDGAGKTTIANHLKNYLSSFGYDCVILKEPSDSIYGKRIKSLNSRISPEEELELFILDREIDVRERILPALREGKVVIMDRYYYSNIAYQSARGLNALEIKKRNERIAPKPDLVILLDLSPETAISRLKSREKLSVFEQKEYLAEVRKRFLELVDDVTFVINAEKDVEEVKRDVEEVVKSFLKKSNRWCCAGNY